MLLRQIVDPKLAQNAYLIGCQRTGEALLIDPERDVDRYLEIAAAEGLRITAVTETHIHADFLSGARELAEQVGAKLYLSDEGDADWKYQWLDRARYDAELLHHGDHFAVGKIELRVLHTPGHTPEHLSFLVIDHGSGMSEPMGLISGDFVFVGDLGRPDLLETAAGVSGAMEPSAERLYDSVLHFLDLPDYLQVWPAHGAGSACGKALGAIPSSTVGYERRANPAIAAAGRGLSNFVQHILEGQPEPPLYFARMKQLNRDGVPLLGSLPEPPELSAEAFLALAKVPNTVILDTRPDRQNFLAGHLPGSLHVPANRSFPTVAGSLVQPDQSIALIVEAEDCAAVVRDLVRVGLDHIVGFLPTNLLTDRTDLVATATTNFAGLERLRLEPQSRVLDVRGASEFRLGHVDGALNLAHTRLAANLADLPDTRRWLVHCAAGARATVACSLLEREGFDVICVDDNFSTYRDGATNSNS